jgi:hypothetical protein
MDTVQQGTSVQDALWTTANGDLESFTRVFGRMRKMFPDEVTEACLCYLAEKGLDPAGQSMAFWLGLSSRYLTVSFDPSALPIDVASKALALLRKVDAQIIVKFFKAGEPIAIPQRLLRVLSLVPALGDYTALLPWLRKLIQQPDEHVKSRAVKLLCELRPNKSQIDRQMQDENPRVRANAIEALWNANLPEAADVFQAATADAHHRVVANALVGLHLLGDPSALARMVDLCQSPDALFRSAMAWGLGYIGDERGIPILQRLSKDPSVIVRKRALRSLLTLQPDEPIVSNNQLTAQETLS